MNEISPETQDWEHDPVVLLERHLWPLAPALLRAALDRDAAIVARASVDEAVATLGGRWEDLLAPYDVQIDDAQRATVAETAAWLSELRPRVGADGWLAEAAEATREAEERVKAALDIFRKVFISTVIARQEEHAHRASNNALRLIQLHRKLERIAAHAAFEASRLGDDAGGVAAVAEELRTLTEVTRQTVDEVEQKTRRL
ncbi:hypothetical protein [Jannaschia sp. W003]|uniref:hypothetical protein n=1 Tax=Jannaschia sp. W003 TaxID=2867012 RepID=UPI0021A92FB3|nr:hypothetical protein [Jannaschia sp. W003]UWQ21870.1 hypothetical protein K3554_02240 [Jannaschia sp. W003]